MPAAPVRQSPLLPPPLPPIQLASLLHACTAPVAAPQTNTVHLPYTLPAVADAPTLFAVRAVFRRTKPTDPPVSGPCDPNYYGDTDDVIFAVLPNHF